MSSSASSKLEGFPSGGRQEKSLRHEANFRTFSILLYSPACSALTSGVAKTHFGRCVLPNKWFWDSGIRVETLLFLSTEELPFPWRLVPQNGVASRSGTFLKPASEALELRNEASSLVWSTPGGSLGSCRQRLFKGALPTSLAPSKNWLP